MATFGDVRRRIILLFALGIGLPASLLGYLALRGVRSDLERERREELLEIASVTGLAHDSSLAALARALDSVLAESEAEGGAVPAPLQVFVSDRPLIEAAFRLASDGTVDELVAPGLAYFATQDPAEESALALPPSEAARLDAARSMESRERDSREALAAYQSIASGRFDPRVRAEAVVGIARIRREEGAFGEAANEYRLLESEYGRVRTAGGIPFDLAARLALGQTQLLAGDTAGAASTLLDLYARLVRTERGLSRAQFGFMVNSLRGSLEKLLPSSGRIGLPAFADSMKVLLQEEEAARARTERLLAFQASGGPELVARGEAQAGPVAGGHRRVSLDLGGHSFYLMLGAPLLPGAGQPEGGWGVLLDPDTLRERLVTTLRTEAESEDIQWSLRGPAGEVLASSGGPPPFPEPGGNGLASVSVSLPGGVPPLTIDLIQPEDGLVRTLLTSRQGVFFYGFLLLAGILVFGLLLTVVTVSHQLALARLQSDFVSTVSHEFKSPLTAVRQIAETLHSGRVPSEEKRQKYHGMLLEQSERLSLLIDRVLDFARMDSGEHTFSTGPVDVGEFLEDMVSQAEQRFEHEGFEIKGEIQAGLPTASFDAEALGRAVSNLIENAVKYSGDSREIVVRGFTEDGQVAIAVKDSGIGLDRKEQARVFDRFYRGGDALTRSVKGTGLGLTLVRQIVEGHGGRVDVESEPGQGSVFTIRLPLEGVRE